MTLYVLTMRGIGERLRGNLLDGLPLPPGAERIEIAWPASYGPVPDPFGISYADSLAAGMRVAEAKIRDLLYGAPTARVALAGYSGGAALAGDLAAKLGPVLVDAAVLVADPNDPGSGDVFGIAGRRIVPDVPTLNVRNPNDVICACPQISPLRIIARTTPHVALGNPRAWGAAGADVWRQLGDPKKRAAMAAEIGPWWTPAGWARWERAHRLADGYLSGREHVAAYRRKVAGRSLLDRAGEWLADTV